MTRANVQPWQQQPPETETNHPSWLKASECLDCGKPIKRGYGVYVNRKTFCNYGCYANNVARGQNAHAQSL